MDAPSDGIVIAVDGGGSKTDVWALDPDGTVVATARGVGSNPQLSGVQPVVELIDRLIRQVSEQAGHRPVLQTALYLSGLDLPIEIETFTSAIASRSWAIGATGRRAIVDNDLFALLRVGTDSPDAIALICGTGINCIGIRADGEQVRFAALGMTSGDWGGGWFLGEQALWHAARAVDGRGPSTVLVETVPQVFGLASITEVTEALHFDRLPSRALAQLSPTLFAAAHAGDAVAQGVIERQADEIVLMVTTALRRLDLLKMAVPVVLGGGVIAADDELLLGSIEAGLAEVAPRARLTVVTTAPINGAAMLALESVGAHAAALAFV
ncbi:N-acetylglucosamine kinase [Leifsonia sp. A12D58]|uniref:N-acetylglucosamine kinase n=1 Tax=Leifsonia sp. A12D58 TaxID=3397674 RepID=UPI0039DF7FC3